MDNPKFEIDPNGKLVNCAHCGEKNINIEENVKHCIHCGYSLINECTNYNTCGAKIPANAAFCPYCGSESHFLRSELIQSKRRIVITDDNLPF